MSPICHNIEHKHRTCSHVRTKESHQVGMEAEGTRAVVIMHFLICEDTIPVSLLVFLLILPWESICTPDVFFQEVEKELLVISHHNDKLPSEMDISVLKRG